MAVGIYASILALIHVLASQFRFLSVLPRSKWLSAAGGVAVAYVFVHVFPELKEMQDVVGTEVKAAAFAETHVYLIALVGLTVFYGLERLAKKRRLGSSREPSERFPRQPQWRDQEQADKEQTGPWVFWIHILSFAAYNVLIGYLLASRDKQDMSAFFFFFAMAVHFVTNDYGLWIDHKQHYTRAGRWILAAAVIAGWALGRGTRIPDIWYAVVFSFLAGGVVMNVLKEELPEERESNFLSFLGGGAAYTLILLLAQGRGLES